MCGTGDVDERGRRRGYVSWSVSGGCSWAAIWSRSRCRSSRLAGAAGSVSSKPRSATSSAQSSSAMSPAAAPPAVRVAQRRGRTSGGRGAGRRPLVLRRCRTRQRGRRRSLDEVSEVGAYASHARGGPGADKLDVVEQTIATDAEHAATPRRYPSRPGGHVARGHPGPGPAVHHAEQRPHRSVWPDRARRPAGAVRLQEVPGPANQPN